MTKDDYSVIAYKILAYFYACLKGGNDGSLDKAMELAGCNETYFDAVLQDLVNNEYMSGSIIKDFSGTIVHSDLRITLKGTEFLDSNSTMTKVRSTLGKAFEGVLQAAVATTSLM